MTNNHARSPDVLVIGAGAAGLAAARDLSQGGQRVTVIEARDRIGGRIHTVHDPKAVLPLELGAEFIHGEAPETLAIAEAARLMVVELPDDHLTATRGRFKPVGEFWESIDEMNQELARRLKRRGSRHDFAVSDYFATARIAPRRRGMLQDFVEGFYAAHPERLSARSLAMLAEDGDDDQLDKQFRVATGNDGLMNWLRAGLDPERTELRLSTIVETVHWERSGVTLSCRTADGAALELRARAVIVTVPHAVLRAGAVRFDPALPARQRALELLEAGQVFKVVLRFRKAFWDEDDFTKSRMARGSENGTGLNFLHAHGEDVPTWWTQLPARAPMLTGWAGGPKAESLLRDPPLVRLDRTLTSLARTVAVPRRMLDELLDGWSSHDWRADPFSRAAYTYAGVGGASASAAIARPVEGTLFFAGEATDGERIGTVAGALHSGRRAAREVIRALRR